MPGLYPISRLPRSDAFAVSMYREDVIRRLRAARLARYGESCVVLVGELAIGVGSRDAVIAPVRGLDDPRWFLLIKR